jgi:hypothetical protein
VGTWSENELAIPFSKISPLPTPQIVDGSTMYDLHHPWASASRMARSTWRCGAFSGRTSIDSRAGSSRDAGIGLRSV